MFNDGIRNRLGFHETILYKKYNLSTNPVDILSFANNFLEFDFAKGMIFKSRRSGVISNWTMTVHPVYKVVESSAGGNTWYMTESKDVISSFF